MGESYQAILIDHDNDPISYNEALEDVDEIGRAHV